MRLGALSAILRECGRPAPPQGYSISDNASSTTKRRRSTEVQRTFSRHAPLEVPLGGRLDNRVIAVFQPLQRVRHRRNREGVGLAWLPSSDPLRRGHGSGANMMGRTLVRVALLVPADAAPAHESAHLCRTDFFRRQTCSRSRKHLESELSGGSFHGPVLK